MTLLTEVLAAKSGGALWTPSLEGPATQKSQPLNILALYTQEQKTKPTSFVKPLQKNAG